jgi:(2Fe-2S) ferredoxin
VTQDGVNSPQTKGPSGAPTQDGERWAFVCHSSSCRYRGAEATGQALAKASRDAREAAPEPAAPLTVVRAGCVGLCSAGPAVVTYPAGDVYLNVTEQDAPELAEHIAQDRILRRHAIRLPDWYRENIVGRLGAYVQLLRRRASGS